MVSKRSRRWAVAAQVLAWPALLVGVAWGALALWFDGPAERWLAGLLAGGFAVGCVALLALVRPFGRGAIAVCLALAAVLAWWLAVPPRNDRDWSPDVARLPRATIAGNRVTIENVRDFEYRTETDFTERWETRTYHLDRLRGVDMFLSFWGPTLIAHTIVSWEFDAGPPLAVSIETRKERGESYSALRGFFRQYEVYYVVADERDVIRLRTNYRGERVYLYRLRLRPDRARAILLDYLKEVNYLAEQPRWYNALTHNCTTTIRHHAQQVGADRPWDWRILANGRLDEMGYERGQIDTSLPFPELKARSDITGKAKAADAALDFSNRIREGLPGMRPHS
ncbi:MAG TPA: DUF4105 domain-containing protein [Candidatus Methylomirabilis sp.]|nr:DUF4105 domain-containing protein [Candidatus Methylomirabilis sp.]